MKSEWPVRLESGAAYVYIYALKYPSCKALKSHKIKTYSILVAEFYSLDSAKMLQKKLTEILENSNYHLIYINNNNSKSFELLLGPYNTINKLKNDYSLLYDSDFEDLDIKINE